MELQPPNEEGMVQIAVAELAQEFEATDRDRVEAAVRNSVAKLWDQARVKSFIGIIAERHAREQLRRSATRA